MSVPGSIRSAELNVLWERLRERLEKRGLESRGRVRVPDLSREARLVLQSLAGKGRLAATVELRVLEVALVRLGVGHDLPSALVALGYPVSGDRAAARSERIARREAREIARAAVESWPEPWACDWIDGVIRAGLLRGLGVDEVRALVAQVRLVLARVDEVGGARVSRVDLAAQLVGSAHALDAGTRLEAVIARALRLRLGPASSRELWEQSGVHLDLTSAPVLTWRLPLMNDCALAPLAVAAAETGIPLHLSRFALEQHPARVSPGACLLVAENPRVVEAAAQARIETSVLSTNGQPSSAVLLLLEQLRRSGAELRYHGDFDTAGLAICERMTRLGLVPWRMSARDYRAALAAADAAGARLPVDSRALGPTSWDPELRCAFAEERRIVHEERLLPGLLDP